MTFRLPIFFSLAIGPCALLLCAAASALPCRAATVVGRVELRDSKDPVVRKKSDFSGVVVWLEPVDRAPLAPTAARPFKMLQKGKTFTPHVLAIPVGATVDFPNFDPIFHNAFSNYNGQIFDVGLYPPGSSRSVRFSRPGVVRVFCNIHAAMSAVIVVVPAPFYGTSGTDGSFSIPHVPPGDYYLRIFHERATLSTLEQAKRRLVLDEGTMTVPTISISENGYLAIPHTNKYGREYSPAPDEGGVYPGARK